MTLPKEAPLISTIDRLRFEATFVSELPGDPEQGPRLRQVDRALYSRVSPTPVPEPRLLAHSREMAAELGLDESDVFAPAFAEVLAGNRVLPAMTPYAACYGGHQFGNWAGQLGDGRAITLGEVRGTSGNRWELQLKGAGPTPYSRRADGRAVLRSSVREFLCSEAMHHLGVPTTRALALVGTGESVIRDMFYDGHPRAEPGAVVCRMAPSFLRFGNFEFFAWKRDTDTLRALADYTLRHLYPELLPQKGPPGPEEYAAFFGEVCRRTAHMVVEWMRVGFVHGVMNTDNMSILGLTIDYGPYGWLEDFDPTWTPNTTDAAGRRYRYGQQPRVAKWNLLQLGNALVPLVERPEPLEAALHAYDTTLDELERRMMMAKLGLGEWREDIDRALVVDLLDVLLLGETDMTLFYRALGELSASEDLLASDDVERRFQPLAHAYYAPHDLSPDARRQIDAWLRRYLRRVLDEDRPSEERRRAMHRVNPLYVLRNYLAQQAIDRAEEGDPSLIAELLEVLRRPYVEQPGKERFAEKRPEWARHRPGCSMLSCSS